MTQQDLRVLIIKSKIYKAILQWRIILESLSLYQNFFLKNISATCWFYYIKQPKWFAVLMWKNIKRRSVARLNQQFQDNEVSHTYGGQLIHECGCIFWISKTSAIKWINILHSPCAFDRFSYK